MVFGRVVATKLKGARNAILANLEMFPGSGPDDGDQLQDNTDDEPFWFYPGFYSRPAPPQEQDGQPTPKGHAEHFSLRFGDRIVTVAGRDLRISEQVNPGEGAVGMAQYGGGFVELSWNADQDGTDATIYAARKVAGVVTKAHVISLDSAAGSSSISIVHESGARMAINSDGHIVMMNAAGDAFFEVDDTNGEVKMSAEIARTTGFTVLGSATNPATDTTLQKLVKQTEFDAWRAEVDSALTALATHVHPGVTAGMASTGAVAGVTAPSSTPEFTDNVKAK